MSHTTRPNLICPLSFAGGPAGLRLLGLPDGFVAVLDHELGRPKHGRPQDLMNHAGAGDFASSSGYAEVAAPSAKRRLPEPTTGKTSRCCPDILVQVTLRTRFPDAQCGFKAIRADMLRLGATETTSSRHAKRCQPPYAARPIPGCTPAEGASGQPVPARDRYCAVGGGPHKAAAGSTGRFLNDPAPAFVAVFAPHGNFLIVVID